MYVLYCVESTVFIMHTIHVRFLCYTSMHTWIYTTIQYIGHIFKSWYPLWDICGKVKDKATFGALLVHGFKGQECWAAQSARISHVNSCAIIHKWVNQNHGVSKSVIRAVPFFISQGESVKEYLPPYVLINKVRKRHAIYDPCDPMYRDRKGIAA